MTRSLSIALAAAALLAAAHAQAAQAVRKADPDITGSWERWPSVMYPPKGPVQFGSPPMPPPPLKPDYLAAWQAEQKRIKQAADRGEPVASGYEVCLPDGMPTMMNGMFPMEVLQSRGQVTVIQEAYNQVRRIYLGEKPSSPDEVDPSFYGRSAGHWEGDALVVDTVGIKDTVRLRGVPHSPNVRIHERLHLMTPDILHDDITIEDPEYLTEPWRYTVAFKRMPRYKMQEYVCEDNRQYVDANGIAHLRIDPKIKDGN